MDSMLIENIVKISKGKKHNSLLNAPGEKSKRYIQIEDLRNDLNLKYTDDKGVDVNTDDVIIAWDGANAGTIGFGLDGYIGSTLARLRLKNGKIDSKYLGWLLRSKFSYLRNHCTGATIPHISKSVLENIEVPLIPIKIQQKIAGILEQVDVARQKRKQASHLTEQFLQSAFLEMFGDPVRNEKGWEIKTLEELSEEIVDCPHSTPIHHDDPTSYPCIRTTDMKKGQIVWNRMKYVQYDTYIERTKRLIPQEGDIVFAREGNFGEAVRIPKNLKVCLGQRTMLFRPNRKICNSEFLWSVILSDAVYHQAFNNKSGSTVNHINVKDIKMFKGYCPPLSLQQKFASLVVQVEQLRNKQLGSEKELDNLFRSLMQNYFG